MKTTNYDGDRSRFPAKRHEHKGRTVLSGSWKTDNGWTCIAVDGQTGAVVGVRIGVTSSDRGRVTKELAASALGAPGDD